jgi:hypothetical protein
MWAAAMLLLAACVGEPERHDGTNPPGADRRLTSLSDDEAWTVGGDPADTLLFLPVAIEAAGGAVFLLDRFGHRVAALDAATGRLAWTRGRRGGGPGELDSPRAMALGADSALAIADGANPRIARFARDGTVDPPIPLRDIGVAQALCGLSDGGWVVATLDPGARLLRLAPDGAVLDTLSLPGPHGDSASVLTTQVVLAGGGTEPCALLFAVGAGFALWADSAFAPFRPFVEPITPPRVEVQNSIRRQSEQLAEPVAAALDAALVDDEVWVLFGGASDVARRVLDRYGRDAGEYRGSWLLPTPADGFAVDDERLYLLVRRSGYPAVVAVPRPPIMAL